VGFRLIIRDEIDVLLHPSVNGERKQMDMEDSTVKPTRLTTTGTGI
jgi:hypothetical protein